jgi:sugar transferase EpsL
MSSMSEQLGRLVKRGIDVIIAALVLLLSSPLMALVLILVRVTMGPPALFKQVRLGYKGRMFTLLKFRTMTDDKDAAGRLLPDEARITPLGLFLRRTSLDELPELVNVLRGEMSIVGPRPLLPEYRELYSEEQWRRHDVLPGIAGLVLAEGRNGLPWPQKFELDVWYVDNWSLRLDAQILIRTLWRVLRRKGISAEGHATMPLFEGNRDEEDS